MKKYALNNSYFKNRQYGMPDTILEIAQYHQEKGELPFAYSGKNWVYDAFCERQKRKGVHLSQYLTPDATADRMIYFAENHFESNDVMEPCCGTGQITKELLKDGYNVSAFELDYELASLCEILYPNLAVKHASFADIQGKYNQIIANPPYEIPVLTEFLKWILSVQDSGGVSILLIPKHFIDKEHPKALFDTLRQFSIVEREDMREEFERTKVQAEIVVLRKL